MGGHLPGRRPPFPSKSTPAHAYSLGAMTTVEVHSRLDSNQPCVHANQLHLSLRAGAGQRGSAARGRAAGLCLLLLLSGLARQVASALRSEFRFFADRTPCGICKIVGQLVWAVEGLASPCGFSRRSPSLWCQLLVRRSGSIDTCTAPRRSQCGSRLRRLRQRHRMRSAAEGLQ